MSKKSYNDDGSVTLNLSCSELVSIRSALKVTKIRAQEFSDLMVDNDANPELFDVEVKNCDLLLALL